MTASHNKARGVLFIAPVIVAAAATLLIDDLEGRRGLGTVMAVEVLEVEIVSSPG